MAAPIPRPVSGVPCCSTCGQPNGRGKRDLRPYGPDGVLICFECATSAPASDAAARRQFRARLDCAADESPVVIIGDITGPRPYKKEGN